MAAFSNPPPKPSAKALIITLMNDCENRIDFRVWRMCWRARASFLHTFLHRILFPKSSLHFSGFPGRMVLFFPSLSLFSIYFVLVLVVPPCRVCFVVSSKDLAASGQWRCMVCPVAVDDIYSFCKSMASQSAFKTGAQCHFVLQQIVC